MLILVLSSNHVEKNLRRISNQLNQKFPKNVINNNLPTLLKMRVMIIISGFIIHKIRKLKISRIVRLSRENIKRS